MRGRIVFVTMFVLMLLLPSILMFTSVEDSYKKDENRRLAKFKISSIHDIKSLIINFKNNYTDNFGTRFILYNFYKKQISDRFNESPSNDKVILGKENWLFIGDFQDQAFSEAKGTIVFSKSELEFIKNNIDIVKNWCKKHQIEFYLTIPPGKHTIYKEFLPYQFPQEQTKLDQLIKIFPEVIDMRKDLIKSKKTHQVYMKNDTHWNEFGAFTGYKSLMNAFSKKDKNRISISQDQIVDVNYMYHQGDIANMLKKESLEKVPKFVLPNNNFKEMESILEVPYYHRLNPKEYEQRYHNRLSLNPEKIMVLRDSFSSSLKKFIIYSFQDALFIYNHFFDENMILQEKPNILVYEITERFIDGLLKIHEK